jgi:hypothetical protein
MAYPTQTRISPAHFDGRSFPTKGQLRNKTLSSGTVCSTVSRRNHVGLSTGAAAKLTAKLLYQLMEDLNLFEQTVRLHAFSRTSIEGILSSSEVWQFGSALCQFALGKLKVAMIEDRLASGGH